MHGKFTVVVARAEHPQLFVTATVVVHPGMTHERQTVPVEVKVGQLRAGPQSFVVVRISVFVAVIVVVWIKVAVTLLTDVIVLVCVVVGPATDTVFVTVSGTSVLVQVAPRQTVVGVRVMPI